ncbi:MAG: histidinol-phosphate transaminase [Erysipelotrichaceae bacterium]|nr:histidinol-phosphate transaminase [Erysipelotrichaceae bacterium]
MSWRNNLRAVEPYVAGEQPKLKNLIKLNTNENPYGPGRLVKQAIRDFEVDRLRLYPNADAEDLRHALAEYYGLKDRQIFLGNGSDEVLALTFLTCFNSDLPILFPDITYSFYPVYCELFQIDYELVPLRDDFSIAKEDYFKENGGVIFPNPNAPTGSTVTVEDIEDVIRHNPNSVVVIDEAYVDFGGDSVVKLIDRYENLLVIHTFSKFRGLAGIRLGVAMGSEELVSHLYDVKNSFNSYPIDALAQAIGLASVKDSDVIKANAAKVMATRERVVKELKAMGFTMPESRANFIFIKHESANAKDLFMKLRAEGIVVRYFNQPRIDQYLRVSIGTDEQMDRFLEVMKDILAGA